MHVTGNGQKLLYERMVRANIAHGGGSDVIRSCSKDGMHEGFAVLDAFCHCSTTAHYSSSTAVVLPSLPVGHFRLLK